MISLGICVVVYMLVAFGAGSTLSVEEIVQAKDHSLAEAAKPVLGGYGVCFTVGIAIMATVSGLLASVFAVFRMLAMLTDMSIIRNRRLGMLSDVQVHTLVYTVLAAALLAAFFNVSRIAPLDAIFYLVGDIAVHWGALRHLRSGVAARPGCWLLLLVSRRPCSGHFDHQGRSRSDDRHHRRLRDYRSIGL